MKSIATIMIMLAVSVALAEDVKVTFDGQLLNETFTVTTNETVCGHLDAGGHESVSFLVTAQMVGNSVVLIEKTETRDSRTGILVETNVKTTIPLTNLPWSGQLSTIPTNVKVYRIQPKETQQQPNIEIECERVSPVIT
jgi:hypothetical protein